MLYLCTIGQKIAALRQRRSTIKAMLDEIEKGNDGVGNEAKKSEGGEVTGVPDTPPATLYMNKPPGSTHKKDRARRLRESRSQRRNLYITGFGSFGDIEANPTQQIVEYLQEEDFGIDGYDCSFNVLHVSTGGVDDYLDEREACVKPGNINVHIGVHGKATRFALEKFCYNNKDFRIPDSSGKQPEKEPIDASMELDASLMTDFNVTDIKKKLSGRGFDVEVSDDPGRYICNYIYFTSSQQQARILITSDTAAASDVGSADQDFSIDASADEKNKTVFIHVPPFDMIPKQTQIEFVKAALDLLCKEDACDRAWADSPRTASSNTMCEIPGTDCSVDFFDLGCSQS